MKIPCLLGCVALAACSTQPAPPPAKPEPARPEPAKPEPSASAAPVSAPSAAPSAQAPAVPPPDTAPREVKYVVTGGKLEVVVEGVRFKPSAKAIKIGAGWGVALDVDGEAEDDAMHSLAKPKAGALALAAKITRKGGKVEAQTDTREGDDEDFVTPGTLARLERRWPTKASDRPLGAGDKLELQVGLWGIGADAKSRRPLKKFFIVTMVVGKGEPRPLVAPPE